MVRPRPRRADQRRRHLREVFDGRVEREWNRYAGEPRRILVRTLRERFLRHHLRGRGGTLLELGPGPGRFTPIVRRRPRERVIGVDLSRECLKASRRRAGKRPGLVRIDGIQGAAECLPLSPRSIDVAVVLGNIVNFAALEGTAVLKELRRVVTPAGSLLIDFASPTGATEDFLYQAARQRLLPRILRRPGYYFLDQVLRSGYQPYAPARLGTWEFRFYTVAEAVKELTDAGFRAVDVMSIAPIAAYQDRIVSIARRQRRTWETLLRLEEQVGRRPGTHEVGHGFAVAAVRT